jgi:hypothetical protein
MKLRFRRNSVRLRVNRREVECLATGQTLAERVHFPGDTEFAYTLQSVPSASPRVEFKGGVIRVEIPKSELENWASTDAIGMYFELPANGARLKVAIEKDLECVDGPPDERDPDAYPRVGKNC